MRISGVEGWIERRSGGYRHRYVVPDPSLPERLTGERRVAVIGAGLAGLIAALGLARRGFRVVLLEKDLYLGGKVGAWPVELPGGERNFVEHGFHAFFPHYHNLLRVLGEIGATRSFKTLDDYRILTLTGQEFSFKDVAKTPVLNVLSMLRQGVFSLKDVFRDLRTMRLMSLLEYHPEDTFRRFDHVSFAEYARRTALPDSLRLIFNSFSRAFFAPPSLMSSAELIKSFHFFFLSHDGGLGYDYPTESFEVSLLEPFRSALEAAWAEIRLSRPVGRLELEDGGVTVDGERFDYAVLAADVVGSRRLALDSPGLADRYPRLHRELSGLRASQRYAVLRLWVDRDISRALPGFVITEHRDVLDSISFYPRLERQSAEWAARHGGSVLELHSYAVPEHVRGPEDVRTRFLAELEGYLPEARGMKILHEHLQLRHDFTALHVGLQATRPAVETECPRLCLAGDWVKLPRPALLMEAAAMSGLLAANTVLAREGLRLEAVDSVPPVGLLARR